MKRSLTEITLEAVESVQDLIVAKSIYKGVEHIARVNQLKLLILAYNASTNKEQFLWVTSAGLGEASGFRNSVIGTLLVDLSEGKDIEFAVKSYETKVAPENYKRSSSLITQAMINRAQTTIVELGLESSIHRRHAVVEDITINDVLFADRSAQVSMGVLDMLAPTAVKNASVGTATDISIADFMTDVVPSTDSMELLLDNAHQNNFMSLVAPVTADSPPITKWSNNFSWSYNGEIADSSMRENVKAKGGNVDGVLRFSIQWNTPDRVYVGDLDAHCLGPKGDHIFYGNKRGNCASGTLDVDIMSPRGVAVENIIYTDERKMPDGKYCMKVNNYSSRKNDSGFTAEIEFGGQILSFNYPKSMRGKETVVVATIVKKGSLFTVMDSMKHSESTVSTYGIVSKKFHKVNLLMQSPNHWDSETNPGGNKHYFFILDKCLNPDPVRGLYNEFLANSLHDHRKVFEMLGSKLKVPFSDQQLSGLGFSETQENTVTVKVRGKINSVYNVKFN